MQHRFVLIYTCSFFSQARKTITSSRCVACAMVNHVTTHTAHLCSFATALSLQSLVLLYSGLAPRASVFHAQVVIQTSDNKAAWLNNDLELQDEMCSFVCMLLDVTDIGILISLRRSKHKHRATLTISTFWWLCATVCCHYLQYLWPSSWYVSASDSSYVCTSNVTDVSTQMPQVLSFIPTVWLCCLTICVHFIIFW